jgi:hypothetical protein
MMKNAVKISLVLALGISLSACDSAPQKGPDEFSVLPTKPLVYPEDTTTLPTPNATGINRADKRPLDDATVALGGNADRLTATTVFSHENALLSATGRHGVTADIRTVLADEDAEFRKRNKGKVLERWVGGDVYNLRYKTQRLDEYAELLRLQKLGIRTPTAPPQGQK